MPNFKNHLLVTDEARAKILAGANKLADTVVSTLGPRGENVAYSRIDPYGNPWDYSSIHDGVKIAKEINLEDEAENIAAQILKEAAQKTVDQVGDGTTLTICLAQAILNQCFKVMSGGVNSMSLRQGLEQAVEKLVSEIKTYSVPVDTLKDEIKIATISCADEELGRLVGETLHKMGSEGVVSVEESRSAKTYVEYQEGMMLENGYLSDWFFTDPERMAAVHENPYLLVTDKEINSIVDLAPLLNEIHESGKALVIISPSVSGEALELLVQNKIKGILPTLAIKAPLFGEHQKALLGDIAALTGATLISQDAGWKLKDIKLEHLGLPKSVSATKKSSLIVASNSQNRAVLERISTIKSLLEEETDDFKVIKLKERLGKLTNGIAVIYAGGSTQIEMKEKFERLDDAVHATRAAMQGGIIPGGETIFLKVREILGKSLPEQILYSALETPFNKLVKNAGQDAGELRVYLSQMWQDNPNYGYDVISLSFVDLIKKGIIDPSLVPQNALKNAVSVAIALMTTGRLIVPVIPKGVEAKR